MGGGVGTFGTAVLAYREVYDPLLESAGGSWLKTMGKQFFVYILASKRNGTLYTGVTSTLGPPRLATQDQGGRTLHRQPFAEGEGRSWNDG